MMKIIVGKSMDTRTPLLEEQMRYIEFQPYWNVPPSIARGEVVPACGVTPLTSIAKASSSWPRTSCRRNAVPGNAGRGHCRPRAHPAAAGAA